MLSTTLQQSRVNTPLGPMFLAASDQGLAGAWFVDEQRHLPAADLVAQWPLNPAHPVLREAASQISAYFGGTLRDFDVPLDLTSGTPFQQAVWQALRGIAPGQTTSYGQISAAIGKPAAVRAVGAAVGRNPISIIVPCHRVLGANGSLTGYAGGLHRKAALLKLEHA